MKHEFIPDLIVEVTSVCDRACAGCYAPNVVTSQSKSDVFKANPEFFLAPLALKGALEKLNFTPLRTLAFRGGEPSRHPQLPELIGIAAKNCSNVILETHGRWILESENEALLQVCKDQNVQMKISFDRMHGLASETLIEIWSILESRGIQIRVAITEPSESEFLETRALCKWIPDSQIIFQQKATSEAELVKPNVGVINRKGQISLRLTSHFKSTIGTTGVA